jgi:GTP-binding protein
MYQSSEYVISAVSKAQFPNKNNSNEYVFLGRSNVGKSSFINSLTNKKMLARTSAKPGKTITINFYLIDKSFYLVDVPGYGYANRSKEMIGNFGAYIEEYLTNNPNLRIAFLLVDTKVGPTNDDIMMYNYLKHLNLQVRVIATKSDKVGTTKLIQHQKAIQTKLGISADDMILTSAVTKLGMDKLRNLIR